MRLASSCGRLPAALTVLPLLFVFVPRVRAQNRGRPAVVRPVLQSSLLAPPAFPAPRARAANFRPNVPSAPRKMSAAERRAWFLLAAAQHGAALFDARTTRGALRHYHELDPLLRPFAHSPAIYPVMQIAPLGFDWLARRLSTSRHRWLRDIWWLPQAAATAGFIWSGAHNLNLPSSPGTTGP